MADLGAIQIFLKLLRDDNNELQCLAAETIAHVAQFKRARRIVRINGGITSLVSIRHTGRDFSYSTILSVWFIRQQD